MLCGMLFTIPVFEKKNGAFELNLMLFLQHCICKQACADIQAPVLQCYNSAQRFKDYPASQWHSH